MKRLTVSLCLLLSGMMFQGFALPSDSCIAGSTKLTTGETEYYRLYVPRNYSTQYRYPLVMCLHGIGERGADNRIQIDNENMSHQWMLDSVKSKYKPFVLYPQCPANLEWTNWGAGNLGYSAPAAIAAIKIIDSLIKVYPIDTTRLYVGGLSWGGMGTEGIMITYPNKFAASFPCAGENRIMTPSIMSKTPFWLWHGAQDPTVDPKPDSDLVNTLITQGTPVVRIFYTYVLNGGTYQIATRSISTDSVAKKVAGCSMYFFTDITNGNHNASWNLAFFDPVLVPWLMSKSKAMGVSKCTWPAPGPIAVTAVSQEPQAAPVNAGELLIAGTTVRWNGVSQLPARIDIYSANGTLVMRHDISQRSGEMACSGLAKGVYIVEIVARDWSERKMMTF